MKINVFLLLVLALNTIPSFCENHDQAYWTNKIKEANKLYSQNKVEEAKKIYQDAVKECESDAAMNNLAIILSEQHDIKGAIRLLKRLKQRPGIDNSILRSIRGNLAHRYLLDGNYSKGFEEYETRLPGTELYPYFTYKPEWNGESLYNKEILLVAEQGIGDAFMFIRYAKILKYLGARVVLGLHYKFLEKIFSLCPYIDKIIHLRSSYDKYDYRIRLMSLAHRFKTTVDTVPKVVPYMSSDEQLQNYWKKILRQDKNFKVGLCWNASQEKENETVLYQSNRRVVSIEKLAAIGEVHGVTFYSFQKEEQNNIVCKKLIVRGFGPDFDKAYGSFMDTAAVMKNLDLVITVDTSVAHLAGALGVPTWILMSYESDWRWMLHRNDSPWYPTVKLFRQPKSGDWESVIIEVNKELQKLVDKK